LLVGAVLLVPQTGMDDFWLVVLILAGYQAYLGLAWNVVAGMAGQLSLCNAVFVTVGAYTSTIMALRLGISPWLGMWPGAALAAILASGIGWLFFRYRLSGMPFALGTFAVSQIALWFLIGTPILGARDGFQLHVTSEPGQFQFQDRASYFYVIMGMVLLCLVVISRLRRSRVGYYFRAIREDQDAAEAVGVHLVRYKTLALAISAALSAIGGTFLAQFLLFVAPELLLKPEALLPPIIATMFGGIGTSAGPILGAAILVPAVQWMRTEWGATFPGIDLILYGVVLMVVMTFLPEGIVGTIATLRRGGHLGAAPMLSGVLKLRRSVRRQGG